MPSKGKGKKKWWLRSGILLIFLIIPLIFGYVKLRDGIKISSFSLGHIAAQEVFIQLNSKLVFSIDSLDLSGLVASSEALDLAEIPKMVFSYLQMTLYVLSFFESLELKHVALPGGDSIAFHYTGDSYKLSGTILGSSIDTALSLQSDSNNFHLKLDSLSFKGEPLDLRGDVIYTLEGMLVFNLGLLEGGNEILSARGSTDFRELDLRASSARLKNLELIRPYIDEIKSPSLRNTLQGWMYIKTKYDSLQVTEVKAHIKLDDLQNSLLNDLVVKGEVENARVTLNEGTLPILSPRVLLEFKNASLKITPLFATFAGMDLHGSEVLVANMPRSSTYISLNGTDIRLDPNLNKVIESYGISLPLTQQSLGKKASKTTKKTKNPTVTKQALKETETKVTEAINKKSATIYNKILELNPYTTLTSDSLLNPHASDEDASLHLNISIEHNDKAPGTYLFSLQGLVRANLARISLFEIPVEADKLDVALDITPKQSLVYINGSKVRWGSVVNADVAVLLDLYKKTLKAHTYIHEARLNTENINTLSVREKIPSHRPAQKKLAFNSGIYLPSYADFMDFGSSASGDLASSLSAHGYSLRLVSQAMESKESKKADEGLEAKDYGLPNLNELAGDSKKSDEKVLKEVGENPIWDELKIRKKKTRPFVRLSKKQLEALALQQVQQEKQGLRLEHDFLAIQRATIDLSLSFATDISLEVPALSLSLLHTDKELTIKVASIDKILRFSPIARYYGIHHGNFKFKLPYESRAPKPKKPEPVLEAKVDSIDEGATKTYSNNNTKSTVLRLDAPPSPKPASPKPPPPPKPAKLAKPSNASNYGEFTLNLTGLEHPLYTASHERLTSLTLKGKIQDGALTIVANSNLDFKTKDSLSMLRVRGYRINIDEAYTSEIPFLVDLLKENKTGDLPYSDEAISQELRLTKIKNNLRKKFKMNPTDFNIIGEDLQLTFLGYTLPFDSINMRFIDERIYIDGQYGKGIVNASIVKDNAVLRARNFSGHFVNTVLVSAKGGKKLVEDGTFSLDLLYRGGTLNASAEIQNTALVEFKALQNILSLIDTVPSLFVFKNPHITDRGYQINYGKVLFAVNADYIGLQNIFLLGASMDVNGWGIIDRDTQELNVNLHLSTIKNLSKFINKIPVLGYLILGREGQISTNLILTGKYGDPKVHITLAEDLIKAPFNILRRIFAPIDMLTDTMEEAYQRY